MIDITEHNCPIRTAGHVLSWSGDNLLARSKERNTQYKLNRSAAAIWLMCDGRLRVRDIKNALHAEHGGNESIIRIDIAQTLAELENQGAVDIIRNDAEFLHACGNVMFNQVIRVGFCNVWPSFNKKDNYFLDLLTSAFNVLVVDLEHENADLVFYSTCTDESFDHHQVDRSATFKIFIDYDASQIRMDECDFAFSTKDVDGKYTGQQYQLPLWCYYVDWRGYNAAGFDKDENVEMYQPGSAFKIFYNAIFSEILQDAVGLDDVKFNLRKFNPNQINDGFDAPLLHGEPSRKLTIGMPVYDEFESVYFTIQALRMYHQDILSNSEIIILDNNPDGKYGEHFREFADRIEECRYIPERDFRSSMVKDLNFQQAKGEYVLCMDSHILVVPGAIRKLVEYLDSHPDCNDLLQGPMLYDSLKGKISTHFDPIWSGGMFGKWGSDPRGEDPEGDPFEIEMQGMALFACRKQAWLGFNPRFSGFGGEEGYVHEKYRLAGNRTVCLPFLRWLHRFSRPDGVPYQIRWEDRIRNYYIGFNELGLDTKPVEEHFSKLLGADLFKRIKRDIYTELANPFTFFDAIYYIGDIQDPNNYDVETRLNRLGLSNRIRYFSSDHVFDTQLHRKALIHREIVNTAHLNGLDNVLILDGNVFFYDDFLHRLDKTIQKIENQPWSVLHLESDFIADSNNATLSETRSSMQLWEQSDAQLTAYSRRSYPKVLQDIADNINGLNNLSAKHDRYQHYLKSFGSGYFSFGVDIL